MTGLLLAAVLTTNLVWHDASRDRDIPARIYAPAIVTNAVPLIVFSHGLGGTRDGYAYLGQHWASNGYICVHVQHRGSDDAVWRGHQDKLSSMRQAANAENARNRPLDISFAITQMLADSRVNTNTIGVAGHSFGANTTLAVAGMRLGLKSYRDPRVKAVIAMSSPRPLPATAVGDIAIPCLHLTGTKDDSRIFSTTAADRRVAFDNIPGPGQYLITIQDAIHMTFAGRGEPAHLEIIRTATTAFWDAYLKGNAGATNVLLGAKAAVEHK